VEVEFGRLYQKARRQREEADYAEDVIVDGAIARQTLAVQSNSRIVWSVSSRM